MEQPAFTAVRIIGKNDQCLLMCLQPLMLYFDMILIHKVQHCFY